MSPPRHEYDYIIAGGGSAGCTLAARLAEYAPDARVLLLEAGGNGKSLFIDMPAGMGYLFGNPDYDWGYHSVPQEHLNGRQIYYPRGKALGGSSIMNGMIYIRGNRRDYDAWRDSGLEGWGYSDLLPYFKRAEGATHRDACNLHGTNGPFKTSHSVNHVELDDVFIDAARQWGLPRNDDFNGPVQAGVGRIDVNVHRGKRMATRRAYLLKPPRNLDVFPRCRVTSLVIDNGQVRGVTVHSKGEQHVIRATRETIVCMGSFGSPQLLMLSGIGPADHLRSHGIAVVADVPGVGQHLKDHINVPMHFGLKNPAWSFARHQRIDRAIALGVRYLLTGDGPGASPYWSTILFTEETKEHAPLLQLYITSMLMKEGTDRGDDSDNLLDRLGNHIGQKIFARGKRAVPGFQIDINQLRPDASGSVRLASANPMDAPLIDPNFFATEKDMRELIDGVKFTRDLIAQPAFADVCTGEMSPGPGAQTDADITSAIRRICTTGHHPIGTCRMGVESDSTAVADSELRVRGVTGLRVVDGSVFPEQITGNPNAPIVAIAEKAADMILGRQLLAPEEPEPATRQQIHRSDAA